VHSAPATVAELEGLRVVVVDDEADARDVVKAVLERSGASVTAVSSCDEALDAIERTAADILVSDLGIPGDDGYELIRRVREHGRRVPALALTAYARFDDRARALSAGYQRHLPKPVTPEELVAAVASLVPSRSPFATPPAGG
jgi:CheY-like chemotaxis protein